MAHADIREYFSATHPRTGETRRFVAVGFLQNKEKPILGDEMLRRVPGAIGEEDSDFLDACVEQEWSEDLGDYYLATNRRSPHHSRSAQCYYRYGSRWDQSWKGLGRRWDYDCLVVCRCE